MNANTGSVSMGVWFYSIVFVFLAMCHTERVFGMHAFSGGCCLCSILLALLTYTHSRKIEKRNFSGFIKLGDSEIKLMTCVFIYLTVCILSLISVYRLLPTLIAWLNDTARFSTSKPLHFACFTFFFLSLSLYWFHFNVLRAVHSLTASLRFNKLDFTFFFLLRLFAWMELPFSIMKVTSDSTIQCLLTVDKLFGLELFFFFFLFRYVPVQDQSDSLQHWR